MPVQTLADIPAGTTLYLDANVLVYYALGRSIDCTALMARLGTDVFALSDMRVLLDAMHKLMLADAQASATKLKVRRSQITSLTKYQRSIEAILRLPIEWVSIEFTDVIRVPSTCNSHGLLCGDALQLCIMTRYGVTAIATNDRDFLNCGVTVYAPTDV